MNTKIKFAERVIKIGLFIFLVCAFALNAQESHLKIDIVGQGKPIILLPGFGCPGQMWNTTVDSLKENYECHMVSYPGFNGLPAIETPWLQTIETELIQYISKLKDHPIAIGHSIGGMLLLKIGSLPQQLFSQIVIVDALPCFSAITMRGVDISTITYNSPQNQQMLQMPDEQFVAMTNNMATYMTSNTEKQPMLKEWFSKVDRKTWVYGYTDLLKTDLRTDIANIKVPVSIITAKNPNMPGVEENINQQYKNISNKTLYFAENSLHFIMFDQPEWFNNTLKKIIK